MNLNLKRKIQKIIIEKQGGQKTSELLRTITREKYKVNVGLYTYGSCFDPTFNVGGTVDIGRYCSFASFVHYYGANHPIEHA